MINLPCNATSMSQVTPCQNVPVQTSQYNFPTCQQRQTSTQQMQTAACGPCSGTSQGPFAHVYQPDAYVVTHQCAPSAPQTITNPCRPVFQSQCIPPSTHPSCGQLSQNILDQIRTCASSASPIFILPGNCQQSPASQQQQPALVPQAMTPPSPMATAYPPSGLTYPAACYPAPSPPSFYPYPIPLPFCDPFIRARETAQNCGCCRKRDVDPMTEIRNVARIGCRYEEPDEHHCTPAVDDTICSKRNCPSSLHLQALASQFLSMQGIIPCAATRLVLRKVPGSNVTTTMEDTMARAQKAISVLTKDQLLSESRNAQQVNALINLHMTANPPPNIIPILTLVQLKMNLLKAQVEGFVNQKIMETQGVGVEVETDLIDPTVLALKSDAELRDFLSVLRQKECDERVNVNFAPYRSQRAIAETRLRNIQNKIRQVEAEFDRRRCAMLPAPTLSSRVVQQFSMPCYSARFEDPRRLYSSLPADTLRSPDPFVCTKPRSPKRLFLKPYTGKPETATRAGAVVAPPTSARANPPKTTDGGADRAKECPAIADQQHSSTENCTCDRMTSEESVDEAKKKLCPRIVEIDAPTVTKVEGLGPEASSSVKLMLNVCMRITTEKYEANSRECEERDISLNGRIPCNAKCWMAKAYINVEDESMKTSTKSESDTITPGEKIDAEGVSESRDAIEIRRFDQIMDRQDFESSANLRQFEEQAETEMVISRKDEAIKEYDIQTKGLRDVLPPKAEQDETKTITTVEIVNDDPISSAQETEQKSSDGVHTLSLKSALKPKKEEREDKEKDKSDETVPLFADETIEQSTNQVPISKSKKKTRFYTVSWMRNIVYDKNCKYQRKGKSDKKIVMSGKEMNLIIDPNIGKLDKYNSIENFLESAVAHDITREDHSENMLPERLNLSKSHIDRQCQTIFEEDKKPPAALLRVNTFPPFRNLCKYMADNEKNEEDVRTYPSLIMKEGITSTNRLSYCNNFTKNILGAFYKNNALYHSRAKRKNSFISEIFSVISDRVMAFINKIITLNRRLLNSSHSAILRKSLNIEASRKDVLIRDHPGLILKDYDPLASTSHYPLGLNQETSTSSKHDFHDTNLLRISTGEGYGRIHKRRHSIIENKENDTKYLLIGKSSHDLILARDLGHPYEVQRSLLIRSRLKNCPYSQNHPHPFSLLKRTGKKIFESPQSKYNENVKIIKEREIRELKGSEKFWTLPKVLKASENNGKISKMREHDNAFQGQISTDHLHDNITNNNVREHTGIGNIIANNELIINVHDFEFRIAN